MRVTDQVPENIDADGPIVHQYWLAHVSDDLATDTVRAAHQAVYDGDSVPHFSGISLEHALWFHRPMRADQTHLQNRYYRCRAPVVTVRPAGSWRLGRRCRRCDDSVTPGAWHL